MAVAVDVHLQPGDLQAALLADAEAGLRSSPRWLPPKWFYDQRGSLLFDEITRLEEYYPTRVETGLLRRHADEIVAVTGADTLVDLGSGLSTKTRILLDALSSAGRLERFVPFDVDEVTLRSAAEEIQSSYPGVEVHAVVGDFEHHLDRLPRVGRRLVAFLGSTIGNLVPEQRRAFLRTLAAGMGPGEALLLGTDLVKDPARLVAAYDDTSGTTAAFNRNVLRVLNQRLAADFRPERFEHRAVWDPDNEWVEMRLRSTADQRVRVPALDMDLDLAAGEEIRTEISAKFTRSRVEADLAAAGLAIRCWWEDPAGDYALSLSGPA